MWKNAYSDFQKYIVQAKALKAERFFIWSLVPYATTQPRRVDSAPIKLFSFVGVSLMRLTRFVAMASLVCTALAFQAAAYARTITLVSDAWPPFNETPGAEREGYMVDVARRVFESAGYSVSYRLLPWKRAVEMTRVGVYDGVIGASKTDAEGFVFPNEELARSKLAFYVNKGNRWRYTGRASIDSVSIATVNGYDYGGWLLEYIEANKDDFTKIQIMSGDDPLRRNLNKMLKGRVDVVADADASIRYLAQQMGIGDQIERAGFGEETVDFHIAFSPAHDESKKFAALLSAGIIELRKSGELAKIMQKYSLEDWK